MTGLYHPDVDLLYQALTEAALDHDMGLRDEPGAAALVDELAWITDDGELRARLAEMLNQEPGEQDSDDGDDEAADLGPWRDELDLTIAMMRSLIFAETCIPAGRTVGLAASYPRTADRGGHPASGAIPPAWYGGPAQAGPEVPQYNPMWQPPEIKAGIATGSLARPSRARSKGLRKHQAKQARYQARTEARARRFYRRKAA